MNKTNVIVPALLLGVIAYTACRNERKYIGLNYQTLYHQYTTDTSILERDFEMFRNDGITHLSIPIFWHKIELNRGEYDDSYLNIIAQFFSLASSYGLKTMVDIHTLWNEDWCTPDYVIDPTTETNQTLAIVRDEDMYSAFIDMFGYTVNYLKDVPHWCWTINEPWYYPKVLDPPFDGIDQKENFIRLFQDIARMAHSINKPATCRFTPVHYTEFTVQNIWERDWEWDQRVLDAFDFIGMHMYWPVEPERYVFVEDWRIIVSDIIQGIRSRGKQVWVTECGCKSDDDDIQAQAYDILVKLCTDLGCIGMMPWHWMSEVAPEGWSQNPPFGGFDLANPDGTPRTAYYELLKFK